MAISSWYKLDHRVQIKSLNVDISQSFHHKHFRNSIKIVKSVYSKPALGNAPWKPLWVTGISPPHMLTHCYGGCHGSKDDVGSPRSCHMFGCHRESHAGLGWLVVHLSLSLDVALFPLSISLFIWATGRCESWPLLGAAHKRWSVISIPGSLGEESSGRVSVPHIIPFCSNVH